MQVLELGCGTGLCGITLARHFNTVVTLTDGDLNVVPLIRRNVCRNLNPGREGADVDTPAMPPVGAVAGVSSGHLEYPLCTANTASVFRLFGHVKPIGSCSNMFTMTHKHPMSVLGAPHQLD